MEKIHTTSASGEGDLITAGHREATEKAYSAKNNGIPPSVKFQGSDHNLALQFKECQKGQIGWFSDKQIISKLPDIHGSGSLRVEKRMHDGTYKVSDAEVREPPQTWNAWKEMTQVFRTSLLMSIAANSQHRNLDINKEELDAFYDWLEGPEFGNHPTHRVPLARLRSAEREAWRKICLKVHEKVSLRDAIEKVRTDYLFWTPLLLGGLEAGSSATGEPKGKGKGKKGSGAHQRAKSKGKGRGATSSWTQPKGKGKGKSRWASKDQAGKEYCWYFNKGSCRGNCNRVHRCCKVLRSGWTCNNRHPANSCTNS